MISGYTLQSETSLVLALVVVAGAVTITALHLAAATRERGTDTKRELPAGDGFVDVCAVEDIPEKRAFVACLSGERVAVFKYDGKISAISNVCRHQNGPLGEG